MSGALVALRRGRGLWLKLHIGLALTAGFLFALLGLTGSLSLYRDDIDALLNPGLSIDAPQSQYQSLDKIIAAVRKAHPARYGAWTLEMPLSPEGMMTAWFDKPQESAFEWYAPLMVSVDPYTAEVVASRFWGSTFSTWIVDLHSHLLLGLFGRQTVGVLGLLLLCSIVSGLYLWRPGRKRLFNAFTVDRSGGLRRWFGHLHRLTGFSIAPILLMLAVTGVFLSFPKALETLTGAAGMGHGETGRAIESTGLPNNRPVLLAEAEFIARAPFPQAELRRITTPIGINGVYQIEFRQDSEINQRHPFTTVWLDRWSGHILEARDPSEFTRGQTFAAWIWPLHSGEAVGAAGRLLWFFSGLGLWFLYCSGLVRWLIRRGLLNDRQVDFMPLIAGGRHILLLTYRAACWALKKLCALALTFLSALRPHLLVLKNSLQRYVK